jgi:hypothetical protein
MSDNMLQMNLNEMVETKRELRLGQFKVTMETGEGKKDYVVNYHSQEQLAEGWRHVLPKRHRKTTVHHFSVFLSQLPPYLWKSLRTTINREGKEVYAHINDNIYTYSIRMSDSDDDIKAMFKELNKTIPNKVEIKRLYTKLHNMKVRGWLMLKAETFLQ